MTQHLHSIGLNLSSIYLAVIATALELFLFFTNGNRFFPDLHLRHDILKPVRPLLLYCAIHNLTLIPLALLGSERQYFYWSWALEIPKIIGLAWIAGDVFARFQNGIYDSPVRRVPFLFVVYQTFIMLWPHGLRHPAAFMRSYENHCLALTVIAMFVGIILSVHEQYLKMALALTLFAAGILAANLLWEKLGYMPQNWGILWLGGLCSLGFAAANLHSRARCFRACAPDR